MQTLTVQLSDRSYPIQVGAELIERVGALMQQAGLRGKVAVVTNPTVAQLYLDPVHESLSQAGFQATPILLPDGEERKNLQSLSIIYDRLIAERFERKSCVLALGGGVIGDLAGFAAATYLRGVPYVQVPTTLLAQVDSSVGGKTGVNHDRGKNLIGAFYQPKLVVSDVAALRSLPHRELVAGLAEVIKYGVISDRHLFELLEQNLPRILALDGELLTRIVVRSCENKARVVEADEREDDYRAVLNFGHTIGHALETATHYVRFLHGEAVGVGMAKAAALSAHLGFCDARSVERVVALIKQAGLPTELPSDVLLSDLIPGMEVDKKAASGKIKFVISEGLGRTRFHWLTAGEILKALG